MRFVKAGDEEKRLGPRLLKKSGGLLGKKSSRHFGIDRSERPAGAVQPYPGGVFERFPRRLHFDAGGERSSLFGLQPCLMLRRVDQQIETMFERAVEVHFADGGRLVAGRFED